MSMPTRETLINAYPGDIWSQAAVVETCVESQLARLIPVGGKIACAPYEAELTDGGMLLTEAVGDADAHVDIIAESNPSVMSIHGEVIPSTRMNIEELKKMKKRVVSFTLSGEVLCAKLRRFSEYLDTSDPSTFVIETATP